MRGEREGGGELRRELRRGMGRREEGRERGKERMNESCTVCVSERVIKVWLFGPALPLLPACVTGRERLEKGKTEKGRN